MRPSLLFQTLIETVKGGLGECVGGVCGVGVGVGGDRKLHQYKLVAVICSLTVPPVPTTPSAERDTLV